VAAGISAVKIWTRSDVLGYPVVSGIEVSLLSAPHAQRLPHQRIHASSFASDLTGDTCLRKESLR
jgi:hypothetical protein